MGAALSLLALALLVLAAVLFALGLRRALQGLAAAWQMRTRQRPLRLQVTRFEDHGQCFSLLLARRRAWRWLPLPRFRAGMYLALQQPAGEGGPASRRYSLAGWRRWPRHYELAIKREPGGRVSHWAGQALRPGRWVEVKPPDGSFVWPARQDGEIVLLAGGIGITPMRAMLQAWLAGPRRHPLTLVWSVRERADLLGYHEAFEELARDEPRLRYLAVLTGADTDWRGERGRIDAARLLGWCCTDRPQGVWMCASAAMMDALHDGLVGRGVPASRIHREAFAAAANNDPRSYAVTLQPGQRALSFQGEPSLLAMLQAAGEPLASDCRNGTCGACRLRLVAGEVRQVIAPEWPLATREVLACCCVPASDLTLAIAGERSA